MQVKSFNPVRQSVVIAAILLVVYAFVPNPHLFTNLPHKISNYISITWNFTIPEVRHVGFLKVHKAGGSTIQNILFRFGILYNESVYARLLPRDAARVAIVRDPLEVMVSGAYYHRDVWGVDYLRKNTHHHPAISDLNLSSSDISKFQLRNFLDVSLYNYFSNIFKSKVLAAGDDFKYEVEHMQSVVSKVTDYCVFHERHSSSRDITVYQSDWNAEFTVNAEDCREMMTSELDFIDKIRKRKTN
ncbi:hypothetical protein MAR_009185 [Mya arenaria]|uniref:Uncharacterized protein n=1 Tax=Mya arenaria TaxID=6604 RepID=A0ABY7E0X0_MYAAR|nr:hypothetical protein MAR_009185 [Mya arenaria]